jgi:hypothetical protein
MTEQIVWIAGLTLIGWLTLRPVLPVRRVVRGGAPQPHLAAGPLVAIAPAMYYGGTASRGLSVASMMLGVMATVFAMAGVRATGDDASLVLGLALGSAVVAATLVASNWFATRIRQRVDATGLHCRLLFGEHTIAWKDVSALTLRYGITPRTGLPQTYYAVMSPTREFVFPHTQQGAYELRRTIEQATGLHWPAPE